MSLDITAVQERLRAAGLDGWLLYDFHGSNPIAARLAGLTDGRHMTTRRWYYLIPAHGEPLGLVHAIERHNLDSLPGERMVYAGRQQLEAGLARLLEGLKTIAMEYSPRCAIPYLSRVDAGTAELIRSCGVDLVSSGDLVQQFEAAWTPAQLATHRTASAALYRIKDRAFQAAADSLTRSRPVTEHQLQQRMLEWFDEEGLVTDDPPIVALGAHAGDPHYLPTEESGCLIVADEVLLLDLWGKTREASAVYADITWVGFTGARVPEPVTAAFSAFAAARDAAVDRVVDAARDNRDVRGWEVDAAARAVLIERGFGERILHRTGHSLGEQVHGNGVHMDDYETHDDRRLMPGTGFTVEPGLYFEHFGVRTEINVYRGDHEALVTGPRQQGIVTLV